MNRCLITYQLIQDGSYSDKGLTLLSPVLRQLQPIDFTSPELRTEALEQATHISVPGIHPRLVASLSLREGRFLFTGWNSKYFITPQHTVFPELPQNADLCLHLAALSGIETSIHGLVLCKDGSLAAFLKRIDRTAHKDRLPVEDFAQLASLTRDNKYDYSIEKVLKLIDLHCTFPVIDKLSLFKRVLFNYFVGNNDMHLKNLGIITVHGKTGLAPFTDCINTRIIQEDVPEETALSIHGKLQEFTRDDLIDYFGGSCCELNKKVINKVVASFSSVIPAWITMIQASFLSDAMKEKFQGVLESRRNVLNI